MIIFSRHTLLTACLSWYLMVVVGGSFICAQTSSNVAPTTEETKKITILNAIVIERNPDISDASRLVGNVKLGIGNSILTCDSAYRFDDGTFEVFSNIIVTEDDGSVLTSEYAVLKSDPKNIYVQDQVEFTHEDIFIECPSLVYSLEFKTVSYFDGASISQGNMSLTSKLGRYSSSSDILYAGGDVVVVEDNSHITSDSLALNRNDGVILLYKNSKLSVDDATIMCHRGRFIVDTGVGWFAGNAVIDDAQGVLAGDSIIVNRKKREGTAWGNVTVQDSSRNMTVKGVYAQRLDNTDIVRGDSITPCRVINIENEDTLRINTNVLEKNGDMLYSHNGVMFEQGSFSGRGDSLSWNKANDEIWLLGRPVVWSEEDELTGDTIQMVLKNNRPINMRLLGHANVLSPANDSLDNQISGRNLDAHFIEGELSKVYVYGNGEVLYYDIEDPEYLRINRANCANITMDFANGKVNRITLLNGPEGRFEKVNFDTTQDITISRRSRPLLVE